jgi:hypothetical protein
LSAKHHRPGHGAWNTLPSIGIVLLWLLWVLRRVTDGVLSTVIILLVADLLWRATKTAIDRKLAETGAVAVLAWGWGVNVGHLRAEDTWLRRCRCCGRVRRADFRARCHRRHVLPDGRRVQGRRVHSGRQLQGHSGRLQHPLG